MSRPPATAPRGWAAVVEAGLTAPEAFAGRAAELAGVRALARADLGLARVLDGHRNGLERVLRHRPQDVPDDVRDAVAGGGVPLGVWGADPRPGEGEPARLVAGPDGREVVDGVKTFCSGAGVVQLALVLVRAAPDGPPDVLALVDVAAPGAAEVDRSWFRSPALRSSESHRVVLRRAPVLAVLGGPGALLREPWFSGDALRTAATWAGALDAVVAATVEAFADRIPSDAEALLAGRMAAAHAAVDPWLDRACAAVEASHAAGGDVGADPAASPARTVLLARLEITERAREVLRLARELTGSWPVATDGPGARAARDLDLLLVQHRLTPAATRLGRDLLGGA